MLRTTLQLDDELIVQAKISAARTGRTLSQVIEDALRRRLPVILCDVKVLISAHKEGADRHDEYRAWLEAGIRGNLVPDAYLAALAIESGSEWITTDRGFARYPGLRFQHPLEPA